MKIETYLSLVFLLLLFAYIVFRVIVKRDYRDHGQLSLFGSALQLLVFCGFFSFPYLYNPPEWSWFWKQNGSIAPIFHVLGLGLICSGFFIAFGTMAWFGIGKAFGVRVKGLTRNGPYKKSRNPQILGGYLLVIGAFMQWPSLYGIGWILIYAIISHWMITSEEEHLSRVFGKYYKNYCSEVPRYLFIPKIKKESST